MAARARSRNSAPSRVRLTPREWRSNRRTPSSDSSRLICVESAGCATHRRSEARVKLRSSAMVTKYRKWRSSTCLSQLPNPPFATSGTAQASGAPYHARGGPPGEAGRRGVGRPSGAGGDGLRLVGDAVAGRRGPRLVDLVRQALDLEREDDAR